MNETARRIAVVLGTFVLMSATLTACVPPDRTVDRAISEINTALATFTDQSDAWRAAVGKLPNEFDGLESRAGSDAKQLITNTSNAVHDLASDAIEFTDAKAQGLIAQAGVEFRCNADFAKTGVRAELTYLVAKLKFWQAHKTEGDSPAPPHNLCWVNPSVMSLYRSGGQWRVDATNMAHKDVVDLYGYNFRPGALPTVQLKNLSGDARDATIKPAYVTRYQVGLDVSTETFDGVQPGSRLVLTWPDNKEPTEISLTPRPAAHLQLSNVRVAPAQPTALQDSVTLHATVTNTGGSASERFEVIWKPDPQDFHVWPASRAELNPGESVDLALGPHTYQGGGAITSNVSISNGDDSQVLNVNVQPPPHQPAPEKPFLDTEHTEHGNVIGGFGKDVPFGGSCDAGYIRGEGTNVITKDSSGAAAIWWWWTNDDPHSCQVTVHYSISPRNWITAAIHIKEKGN